MSQPPTNVIEATAPHGAAPMAGDKIGREAEARLALEGTQISKAVARTMTLAFLFTITSVPLLQHVLEIRAHLQQRAIEVKSEGSAQTPLWPSSYDALGELPSIEQLRGVKNPREAWDLVPGAASFKQHEDTLQNDAYVVQWLLPPLQNWMIGVGVGNEQAYCGRTIRGRKWLHYRPDVDYVSSRGFLDPALLGVKKRAGDGDLAAIQPDPTRAIVDFGRQLKARGIELIVMPTPVKAMMQPETLSSRYHFGQGVLQNPSYASFVAQLRAQNIAVFDVSTSIMKQMRLSKTPQYLETDTHWTPAAMELAARELSRFIQSKVKLPPLESPGFTRQTRKIANLGDISQMLRLPAKQTRFSPQNVEIHPVFDGDGEFLTSNRRADVLILGDSFSNIYSLGGMGWGEGAGFCQQLAFDLKRPIDSITNNAGGSHVTRERLVKELARGRNRLKGKRVVIWQFAMRDLLIGDWKLLQLPAPK